MTPRRGPIALIEGGNGEARGLTEAELASVREFVEEYPTFRGVLLRVDSATQALLVQHKAHTGSLERIETLVDAGFKVAHERIESVHDRLHRRIEGVSRRSLTDQEERDAVDANQEKQLADLQATVTRLENVVTTHQKAAATQEKAAAKVEGAGEQMQASVQQLTDAFPPKYRIYVALLVLLLTSVAGIVSQFARPNPTLPPPIQIQVPATPAAPPALPPGSP